MPRPSHFSLCYALLCWLAIACAPLRADVLEARQKLDEAYAAKLEKLAVEFDERDMKGPAEQVRAWKVPRAADRLTLFVIPSQVNYAPQKKGRRGTLEPPFRILREEQAEALVNLSLDALKEKRVSLAWQWLHEAVRENPDQELARRVLGYEKQGERWLTTFEKQQLAAGKQWTDKFGWLPANHVERYAKGERFALGRWMSAEEDAALRSDIKRGWVVETEHYKLETNRGLSEGVALAQQLETLHAIWQQVFTSYLLSDAQLKRRFETTGRLPRLDARQHVVTYFRSRDEYNAALRAAQPQIDGTLGIYFDNKRRAYFFAGEGQDAGTIYHEATHQLFHEARPVAKHVGRDHNFWIVEGVACYMESLAPRDGYFTLGGADAGRVPAARHRLLEDGYYLPLAELVTLGMQPLQQQPQLPRLYSQSAGLADFLMHDEQGRYREALARYLEAIYSGRDTVNSLAELAGEDYSTLDRQYREFMQREAK